MGRESEQLSAGVQTTRHGDSSTAPPPAYHDGEHLPAHQKKAAEEDDDDDIHSIISINSSRAPESIYSPPEPDERPKAAEPEQHPTAADSVNSPPPPAYTAASPPLDSTTTTITTFKPPQSSLNIILATPQISPTPTSSFLPSSAPSLLTHGIPPTSFHTFLTTLSALLNPTPQSTALSHAGHLATSIPKSFATSLTETTTQSAKNFTSSIKRFNPIGAIGAVVGGIVGVTGRTVGGIVSLPAQIVGTKVLSPRERVEAYVQEANREWFASRGLVGRVLTTGELGFVIGDKGDGLFGEGLVQEEMERVGKVLGFQGVEVFEGDLGGIGEGKGLRMNVSRETLWFVLFEMEQSVRDIKEEKRSGKGKQREERDIRRGKRREDRERLHRRRY